MGIPFFFKHLVVRNPDILIKRLGTIKCTRLFLDYNCAIHHCAAMYTRENPTSKGHELWNAVIERSVDYIHMLQKRVSASFVYVAVDGVCPLSKMFQQRNRRYASSMRRKELERIHTKLQLPMSEWDSNIVTPGTPFMKMLDKRLNEVVIDGCQVQVSGCFEEGEGEQKIFEFIKNDSVTNADSSYDMIYGLDADLIIRSLMCKRSHRVILLRENQELRVRGGEDFVGLDIGKLYEDLYAEYVQMYKCQVEKGMYILDYCMLMSLMGNDFLPSLSYLKIKDQGVHILLNAYHNIRSEMGVHYIQDNQINSLFLTRLLALLARTENEYIKDVIQLHSSKRPFRPQDAVGQAMYEYECLPWFTRDQYSQIDPSHGGWRLKYYQSLFPRDCNHSTVCDIYISGLQWVLQYYLHQTFDNLWVYPHPYSPTIVDLAAHVLSVHTRTTTPSEKSDVNELIKLSPTLQLLIVMPPSSLEQIPEQFRCLISDINYECVHYFPIEFTYHTFLKTHLWECAPKLPLVDVKYLYNKQQSLIQI